MNPTEPSTIARFDWSMGSISKDSTFFREVDLAVAVDAISLTTFLDLIKEREHIIAFATSCNPPSITHIYEAGGLIEHLR